MATPYFLIKHNEHRSYINAPGEDSCPQWFHRATALRFDTGAAARNYLKTCPERYPAMGDWDGHVVRVVRLRDKLAAERAARLDAERRLSDVLTVLREAAPDHSAEEENDAVALAKLLSLEADVEHDRAKDAERQRDEYKRAWDKRAWDYLMSDTGVDHDEVVAHLRGEGPDPFHKECERRLAECEASCAAMREALIDARSAIDRDRSGLADALDEIRREVHGRSWLLEGRGPYEWDDDRYKDEAGQGMRRVLEIVARAMNASGKLADTEFKKAENAIKDGAGSALLAAHREKVERLRDRWNAIEGSERSMAGALAAIASTLSGDPIHHSAQHQAGHPLVVRVRELRENLVLSDENCATLGAEIARAETERDAARATVVGVRAALTVKADAAWDILRSYGDLFDAVEALAKAVKAQPTINTSGDPVTAATWAVVDAVREWDERHTAASDPAYSWSFAEYARRADAERAALTATLADRTAERDAARAALAEQTNETKACRKREALAADRRREAERERAALARLPRLHSDADAAGEWKRGRLTGYQDCIDLLHAGGHDALANDVSEMRRNRCVPDDRMAAAEERGREEGRRTERADVVAWLGGYPGAIHIKRGEHEGAARGGAK